MVSFSDFLKNEGIFKPDINEAKKDKNGNSYHTYDDADFEKVKKIYTEIRLKLPHVPFTEPTKNAWEYIEIDSSKGKPYDKTPKTQTYKGYVGTSKIEFVTDGEIDSFDFKGLSIVLGEIADNEKWLLKKYAEYKKIAKEYV